jgi:hypothetical protein
MFDGLRRCRRCSTLSTHCFTVSRHCGGQPELAARTGAAMVGFSARIATPSESGICCCYCDFLVPPMPSDRQGRASQHSAGGRSSTARQPTASLSAANKKGGREPRRGLPRCATKLKSHAAPPSWVPPVSSGANRWCRRYDNRCRWSDYHRASIWPADSKCIGVPAKTTVTCGAGAIEGHERQQNSGQRGRQ